MKTLLKTQNLSIGYGSKVLFSNLNIAFTKGELVAVIGKNGIGKSTFLRTLAGLQTQLSGEIYFHDKNIQTLSHQEKAQTISVVLTEKLPPSNLTVYELVALGRYPYVYWLGKLSALDKQKIDEAIQLTEIQDLITKNHEEISDGQLQKVLIARALAQDTPLIILDEPTTHLDFQNKINILQLLKKLTLEHQKTIIFSTHDLDFALQIADELLVLTPQTYLKNTPEKLLETPIFNTIFDNSVHFDTDKKQFKIV